MFGEFKKKHHRQALERLVQSGRAGRAMRAGPDTDAQHLHLTK